MRGYGTRYKRQSHEHDIDSILCQYCTQKSSTQLEVFLTTIVNKNRFSLFNQHHTLILCWHGTQKCSTHRKCSLQQSWIKHCVLVSSMNVTHWFHTDTYGSRMKLDTTMNMCFPQFHEHYADSVITQVTNSTRLWLFPTLMKCGTHQSTLSTNITLDSTLIRHSNKLDT